MKRKNINQRQLDTFQKYSAFAHIHDRVSAWHGLGAPWEMLTYDLQFLRCLSIPKLCQFDIESSETALKTSPDAWAMYHQYISRIAIEVNASFAHYYEEAMQQ